MNCFPEPDIHIREKSKVVLELSSYTTKNESKDATGVDTSDLAAKKILMLWKLKLVNVPTSLNNLKTKVDDLDVGRLKTVSADLKGIKWCSR